MSSVAEIEVQFDLRAHGINKRRSRRQAFWKWLHGVVFSFRFVRVSILILAIVIFAVVFYGVENNYNPIYAVGRNASQNGTVAPATGIPSELTFIDALFVSTSLWTNTGLTTVDFSLFTRASQIVAIFCMVLGCLPLNTSYPLWVRLIVTRRHGGNSEHAEYRALVMVACMVFAYFLFFCVVMSTFFSIYCALSPDIGSIFVSAEPSVDPWFGGYFIAFAAFTNSGFSPFGSSVMPFATSPGVIIWLSIFILTGNIAFPAILRLMLGAMDILQLERRLGLPIALVQRNPRAYYQMLFPVEYVVYLTCLWLVLYLAGFALVMGLEWNHAMAAYDPGQKLATAIFSTVTVRTAGLNVLATGSFKSSLLVFDAAMFVISSNPNAIAMKATGNNDTSQKTKSAKKYSTELLVNVVVGLVFCWVLILLFENSNPFARAAFPTFFEIASAFGTVGLSIGFGSSNASLSGAYSTPSKFVIMVLMMFGANRSLPENVDSAIRVQEIPTGHVVQTDIFLEGGAAKKRFVTKTDISFFGGRRLSLSQK